MVAQVRLGKPTVDRYQKLLERVQSIDLGGGGFWKPKSGRSTIRILPPISDMEFFFQEVGQHYVNSTYFYCPTMCNDGDEKGHPCPICEVNQALYDAGEKEAAATFRVGRKFYMNVIDRDDPSKSQIFAAGTTIFQVLVALIGDPDYGDISDPARGFDIKIDKTGDGKDSKYSTLPAAKASPLASTEEQVKELLTSAKDLSVYVAERVLSYDELAKKSSVDVYLDSGEIEVSEGDEEELLDEEDIEEEEEHDEKPDIVPTSVSAKIQERLRSRSAR